MVLLCGVLAVALIRQRNINRRLLSKIDMISDFDSMIEVQCNINELIGEFKKTVSAELSRLDRRCREVELLVDVVDEKILRLSTWCEGMEEMSGGITGHDILGRNDVRREEHDEVT